MEPSRNRDSLRRIVGRLYLQLFIIDLRINHPNSIIDSSHNDKNRLSRRQGHIEEDGKILVTDRVYRLLPFSIFSTF